MFVEPGKETKSVFGGQADDILCRVSGEISSITLRQRLDAETSRLTAQHCVAFVDGDIEPPLFQLMRGRQACHPASDHHHFPRHFSPPPCVPYSHRSAGRCAKGASHSSMNVRRCLRAQSHSVPAPPSLCSLRCCRSAPVRAHELQCSRPCRLPRNASETPRTLQPPAARQRRCRS